MLLEAKKLAHAALLHILFGQIEAVLAVAHYLQARQRFGRIHAREQHAVRLLAATPNATAQLVQLCEAKAFGVLDNHQRGIGHVHAYLDNGGAH